MRELRVLIIEDSEIDTQLVLRDLRRGGYNPVYERVQNTESMRHALGKEHWDIAIADYFVPGFNAPNALAVLKEAGLDLPFIVVSGMVGEETAVAAMRAGAHDYVMKDNLARLAPAIERELRDAEVRHACRRRKLWEAASGDWARPGFLESPSLPGFLRFFLFYPQDRRQAEDSFTCGRSLILRCPRKGFKQDHGRLRGSGFLQCQMRPQAGDFGLRGFRTLSFGLSAFEFQIGPVPFVLGESRHEPPVFIVETHPCGLYARLFPVPGSQPQTQFFAPQTSVLVGFQVVVAAAG